MSSEKLALLGGIPEVKMPQPHFQWPLCGPEEEAAVLDLLRRNEVSYHRCSGAVKNFEDAFAELVGLPFAISSHSGTGALHAAYFALQLPQGAEVITPAYTHLATAFSMLPAGLVPVLCDIDPETGNIDPNDIEHRITERTGAIAITHQYGHACDMEKLTSLASRYNLRIVEDCSHAHGATDARGRHVGTEGDVACFSLQAHKTIWGGEGGMLLTADPAIAERASLLGHFREKRTFTSAELTPFVESGLGLKNRLHPLAAALALVQIRKLPEVIKARNANYRHFCSVMSAVRGIRVPVTAPDVTRGGYFRFMLFYNMHELRGLPMETYIKALHAEGVSELRSGALVRPLHSYALFQAGNEQVLGRSMDSTNECWPHYKSGDFPNAECFAASTLQFPPFTLDSRALIDAYARAMHKVAEHHELLVENNI